MVAGPTRSPVVTIVIADDHRIFREALRDFLNREQDLRVVGEASEGAEAVKLTRQLHPDILLLDLAMPGLDGLGALRQIRTLASATRVILLTAGIGRLEIVSALQLGARGLVLKEAGSTALLRAIRGVHEGDYWVGREAVADVLDALSSGTLVAVGTEHAQDFGLTIRELEIVGAVVAACGNKEIAEKLSISEKTVKRHLTNIFDKLGVSNRLELALLALHHDLKPPK
jgi:two-component system nitrate/nitrite response regulator NarL